MFNDPQHDYTTRLLKAVPQPPPDVVSSAAQAPTQSGVEPPSEPPPPSESTEPPPSPPPRPDRSGRRSALRIAGSLAVIFALVAIGVLATRLGGGRHGTTATGAAEIGTTQDINQQNPATLVDGGNLRLGLSEFPVNWNTLHIDGNSAETAAMLKPTLPRAFIIKPDGTTTLNTDYFTSVELTSESPQVVTYTINPEAVWSDGTPITWEDIAAQIHALSGKDKAFSIASPSGADRVASVTRGVDDRQAVMTFAKPYAEWKGMFAGNGMLLPRSMTSTPEAFNKAQLGGPGPSAGPFMVTTVDRSAQRIVLTRNPQWWGQRPRLDSITYHGARPRGRYTGAAEQRAGRGGPRFAGRPASRSEHCPAFRFVARRAPAWYHFTFNGAPGSILADRETAVGDHESH